MRAAAVLLAALLLQDDPVSLAYGGTKGARHPVSLDSSIELEITGSEALVNMIRSAEAFFSFQKIRIRGEGHHELTRAGKLGVGVKVELGAARVDGVYDDEPYEFDFDRASPPEDLQQDQLKQICWFLSMGGRNYGLGPRGGYLAADPNQDGWGEAMGLIADAAVRLPEKPVKVGEEWTAEWTGTRKQKDNGGRFKYSQKAKIEKIENGRASVAFELKGDLDIPEEKRNPAADVERTTVEAKGSIVIEIASGIVRSSKSSGAITAEGKGTDPNTGDAYELKIVTKVASTMDEK